MKKIILLVIVIFLSFDIYASDNSKQLFKELENEMVIIPGTDFKIMRTEVTQKLWEEVMLYNPSFFKGADLPIETIDWYEAVAFCIVLSKKCGLTPVYTINGLEVAYDSSADGFRLPSTEEWVYAAKGGDNYPYAGSHFIDEVAWYQKNSGGKTHPVAQKKANGYGLYDMSGNVSEFCWDISDNGHHNPGGSWNTGSYDCSVVTSRQYSPDYREEGNVGFRIVRKAK